MRDYVYFQVLFYTTGEYIYAACCYVCVDYQRPCTVIQWCDGKGERRTILVRKATYNQCVPIL